MSGTRTLARLSSAMALLLASTSAPAYYEVQSLPAPANVTAMAYTPQFGTVAMIADALYFARLRDELVFGFWPFAQKYTGISMSPSERFLFVADYGGEINGAPAGTSWVHRYDFATGYNELKTAWIAAGQVQAVSDTRFFLKSLDQSVQFTHNDWGTGTAVVPINMPTSPPSPAYDAGVYGGDFRYVPALQRLIHASESPAQQITAFRIPVNDFIREESSGANVQGYGGSFVLSTDGGALYYGRVKIDVANVAHNILVFPEIIYAATGSVAFGNGRYYDANTAQPLGQLGFSTTTYALNAHGDDFWAYDAQAGSIRHLVAPAANAAVVTVNGYGPLKVSGATLAGNVITLFANDAVIELGSAAGSFNTFVELDLDGLQLGANQSITIKSGAPDQVVFLNDVRGGTSVVNGTLRAAAGSSSPAPILFVRNAAGISVGPSGGIDAPGGLALDARNAAPAFAAVTNQGYVNGGGKLHVAAGKITGSGTFRGDDVSFVTDGNANNPLDPVDFLRNGLHVAPAGAGSVAMRLVANGGQPQFINVQLLGDAVFSMAYNWPSDLPTLLPLPRNNYPANPYLNPPQVDMPYGGGSVIVQTTGSLTIDGGIVSNNFQFAGGIALIANGTLDLNAVRFDNGWSTTPRPFQGVFFDAPLIKSSYGNIGVTVSENQWVNFSTAPVGTAVYVTTLKRFADGSIGYASVEDAVHLNSFAQITAISAAGGCWTCAVNTAPVQLHP